MSWQKVYYASTGSNDGQIYCWLESGELIITPVANVDQIGNFSNPYNAEAVLGNDSLDAFFETFDAFFDAFNTGNAEHYTPIPDTLRVFIYYSSHWILELQKTCEEQPEPMMREFPLLDVLGSELSSFFDKCRVIRDRMLTDSGFTEV